MTDDDTSASAASETHDPDGVPYGDGAVAELFARPVRDGAVLGDVALGEDLPPDGTEVEALSYPSEEYDRPAERVTGPLLTRPVESLGYTQCWVNGTQVDPATVRAANEE